MKTTNKPRDFTRFFKLYTYMREVRNYSDEVLTNFWVGKTKAFSISPFFSFIFFLLWGTIQIRFTLCPTEEWETLEEPLKKLAWESIGAVLESFHSVFWNGALKITVVFLNIICNELSCALLKHVWILNCSYLEKQNVINSKIFFNLVLRKLNFIFNISLYNIF